MEKKTPLRICFETLPSNASVLDVGCLHFSQYKAAQHFGFSNMQHSGVDYTHPTEPVPPEYDFRHADLDSSPIPFDDDTFDFVVASHIIEHLKNPLDFFAELIRVCKPGGTVYVEAPSERSLWLPGMPFDHDKFFSLSLFDDPTHTFRPWSAQSLHRLSRYYESDPLEAGYLMSWKIRILYPLLLVYALITRNARALEAWTWAAVGWASYVIVKKPITLKGKPTFRYYIPANR